MMTVFAVGPAPEVITMMPVAGSTLLNRPPTPRFCRSSASCGCFWARSCALMVMTWPSMDAMVPRKCDAACARAIAPQASSAMNVKTPIRPAVRLVMYLLSTDSSEAVCALNGNPVPVDEPPRQKVEELFARFGGPEPEPDGRQ